VAVAEHEPMTDISREVRLAARPAGLPTADTFSLVSVPVPVPGPGQVLVRNHVFGVAASLRMMIAEGAQDVPGVPFPAMSPGDTLGGGAVGAVLSAPDGSGLNVGDLVVHHLGWREYAAVPVAGCERIDVGLADLGEAQLGNGWTAYAALTRGTSIRAGDTVFVSSAAGSIGSMAGQIARLLGAGRVVGSTGSPAKAERLVRELGFDAVAVRGTGSFAEQLAKAAPDGIDVCLDSVGGEQLRAAVDLANDGARIVILGTLSAQLAPAGTGRTAPVELDSMQLVLKRITLRGYSADDDPDVRAQWRLRSAAWFGAGSLVFPHVRVPGIERAIEALLDTMAGRYLGAVVVEL
jgi:NADPH-dependent curcumin reductase CurA